ncbi:MAG: PaaI family thioesterase [Cellvibrionaceae bacterium]
MQTLSHIKEPIPVSALPQMIQQSPVAVLFDTSIGECSPGYAEVRIPVTDKIMQHRGIVNGAVLGFLADTACCMAAATKSGDVRTQEYKINFIAPAMGQELIGRGSVVGGSFSQVIARADLYARNGKNEYLVATALATLFTL